MSLIARSTKILIVTMMLARNSAFVLSSLQSVVPSSHEAVVVMLYVQFVYLFERACGQEKIKKIGELEVMFERVEMKNIL